MLFNYLLLTCLQALNFKYNVGIALLILWVIIELVRLFYGYRGNLNERVPDLSSFLLISLFPQFPIVIFLGYVQSIKYPIDSILGTIMIVFLVKSFSYSYEKVVMNLFVQVLGFIFGIQAMKQQIRSQTAQFMRVVGSET